MSELISTFTAIWTLCIGWMPPLLASVVTIALAIMVIFLIIRLIALVLSAIPFL